MKRNRGGEQDLDHIIAAASRGMDRATPRVPGQAGPDLLPRPRLPVRAQRDHRGEGDHLARPGRRRDRHRRPGVGDVPRRRLPAALPPCPPVRPRADRPHRRVRPGRRGRPGRRAARARPHRPRREGGLRPAGDGDDPRARHRPRDLPDLEPQHAGRVGLGRVPLDLRHVPPQRGPVHDQHRRARRCSRRTSATRWRRSAGWASWRSRTRRSRPRRRSAASFVPNVSDVAGAPPAPGAARGRGARGGLVAGRPRHEGAARPSADSEIRYVQHRSPDAMCDSRTTSAPRTSLEQGELGLAGDGGRGGDVEDRAVVLLEPDRAVGLDHRARRGSPARPG